MMGNACSLALLTAVGGYIIYKKLPPKAKHLITKYHFLTDLFALIGVYVLFGGTVTALLAGAIVSIIVSVLLHIANHPEDYEWLHDAIERIKAALRQFQTYLIQMNQKYKEKKAGELAESSSCV